MAVVYVKGPFAKSLERDDEGHRTYAVKHFVTTDAIQDGPQVVLTAANLPQVGDVWNFGNDSDLWAFCWPTMKISSASGDQESTKIWTVEQKFTTKPFKRCQDTVIENPLLEPQKVSGTFVKYTKEVTKDRNGEFILNSAHEHLRGPQVEFDHNRPQVHIEQNVADLDLATVAQMVDTVNDSTLWGLGARKIKLSNFSWERLYYGICFAYYKRIFDFDIDFNTFDRKIPDEGSKVLNGEWETEDECATGTGTSVSGWKLLNICGAAPDPDNPAHFCRYKDRFGEPARVMLDGAGLPADSMVISGTGTISTGAVDEIDVEYYGESNFLTLSIPTDFGLGTGEGVP